MKALAAPALMVGLAAFPAHAQDSLAGTYKGSMTITGGFGTLNVGVTLVIAQVEGGKLTGTGTLHAGSCAGDYPIQGGVKGDAIGLISTKKGGAGGDCSFGFKGRVEGNQLVGTMGSMQIVLRK